MTVCGEAALAEARSTDNSLRSRDRLGPLHGVPIAVKDQFLTKGVRTTNGMRALADFVPTEDATAVARLRSAGAILLGKLNMPEAGLLGTRDCPFGQPRNPWNTEHDAGASSTGPGIAVAAGLCAAALGEDTGGSIRNPASYNGIVGVRPSWGRVSRHGIIPLNWSLDTAGPMTRTVAESALLMRIIAGHDPSDPFSAQLPVPDYNAMLDGSAKGLRIGVIRELMESTFLDPEVRDATRAAAAAFAQSGAQVDDVSLPLFRIAGVIFAAVADSGAALEHRRLRLEDPDSFDSGPRRRMIAASLLPNALALRVEQARVLIRDQIRGAFGLSTCCCARPHPRPPRGSTQRRAQSRGNDLSNRFSIPYAVAAAIVHGHTGPAAFETDQRVMRLAARVEVRGAPDLDAPSMDRMPARVTVVVSGRSATAAVKQPYGHPSRPASAENLRQKFREIVSLPWKDALYDRLIGVEAIDDVSDLFTAHG